jgi:putative hydrolase of the HAD superfamily
MFEVIAFDADDTLWDNELLYIRAKARFIELLSVYQDSDLIERRLDKIEVGNVSVYGYGIKSFMLSMVDTAVELSGGRITGREMSKVLDLGRQMLINPVQLFPHTKDVLAELSKDWSLMLLTKGDVFEQSQKIERSGLSHYFRYVEITGDKTKASYQALFERRLIDPRKFLMVGNSLKSDILPVIELGGQAVYIPYQNTWSHEHPGPDELSNGEYHQIDNLGQLPGLIGRLAKLQGQTRSIHDT